MSYQIRCTWAGQHKMILRCTVWCFGKHSDVDPILDRKTILRWSCFDSFEKRAPGLRICQVEIRVSSCVCVYIQEKMRPVHLCHRVYLVDKTFLVQKYIFSCLPGSIRHSLVL